MLDPRSHASPRPPAWPAHHQCQAGATHGGIRSMRLPLLPGRLTPPGSSSLSPTSIPSRRHVCVRSPSSRWQLLCQMGQQLRCCHCHARHRPAGSPRPCASPELALIVGPGAATAWAESAAAEVGGLRDTQSTWIWWFRVSFALYLRAGSGTALGGWGGQGHRSPLRVPPSQAEGGHSTQRHQPAPPGSGQQQWLAPIARAGSHLGDLPKPLAAPWPE